MTGYAEFIAIWFKPEVYFKLYDAFWTSMKIKFIFLKNINEQSIFEF